MNYSYIEIFFLIVGSIILLLAILMGVSFWAYNKNFGRRVEYSVNGNATTFESLSNINREPVSFYTSNRIELSGYIYTGKNTIKTKAMIVFVHGFGGTHQWGQYLREIEYFVENGYSVFSYDNRGCGISKGNSMVGLSQSIVDLDNALTFIEHKQSLGVILYGHSWGGFTVSSILNTGHNVMAVVESSGFNSGKEILFERGRGMIGNLMYVASPFIYLYEFIRFGKYSNYIAVNGINEWDIPVMIMHSEDDKEVPYNLSIVNSASKITNPLIKVRIFKEKNHNLSLSDEAVVYREIKNNELNEMRSAYNGNIPKNIIDEYYAKYDYLISEKLDTNVLDEIVRFFDEAMKNNS